MTIIKQQCCLKRDIRLYSHLLYILFQCCTTQIRHMLKVSQSVHFHHLMKYALDFAVQTYSS